MDIVKTLKGFIDIADFSTIRKGIATDKLRQGYILILSRISGYNLGQ